MRRFQSLALVILSLPVLCSSERRTHMHEISTIIPAPPGLNVSLEKTRTTSAFARILSDARMPGGIATITNCNPEPTHVFPSSGASLRSKLNGIVSIDPQYVWRLSAGVVNISPKSGDPALLNLRIREVKLMAAPSLNEAVNQLLAIPAVRNRISELHLTNGPTRTGIGDLQRPQNSGSKDVRHYTLSLTNVTVREVLNAIARAHGNGVWEYQERHCNGVTEFQIQFLVS
jgi:hypothetical protein